MADFKLVVDISSYQLDSYEFFKALKDGGVEAVIVKLTEGSNPGSAYINPKAMNQIKNARAVGLRVHAYHYAKFVGVEDAKAEADWFLKQANLHELNRDESILVLDYEERHYNHDAMPDINAFLSSLDTAGWQTDIYSSTSFFKEKVVDVDRLYKKQYLWVASYGVDSPGLDGVGIWQFTSEYNIGGQQVDMSYDFFGRYTDGYVKTEDVSNNTNNSNSWTDDFGDVWVPENGTFTLSTPINLRWGAKINSGLVGTLNVGDSVNYDAYSIHDGLVWIRQPRSDGYGYLATGEVSNGSRTSSWGSFE